MATEVFGFVDQFAIAGFRSTGPLRLRPDHRAAVRRKRCRSRAAGRTNPYLRSLVRITQLDRCTSTFVFGSGFVSGVDYRSSPSVREATLTATIPVRFSTPTGPVVVDAAVTMTWTGTGELERFRNPIHFHFPDLIVNAQFFGKTREAVATGSVLVGGTNLTQLLPCRPRSPMT